MNGSDWREEGSATPVVAGIAALLVMFTTVLVAVGGISLAKTRLQTVADLAALGSATKVPSALLVQSEGDGAVSAACQVAADMVAPRQGTIESCTVKGGDIWLVLSHSVTAGGIPVRVEARARAGPA